MGKGGTKFVGDAIAHRSGRKKSTYTGKELRKNMDKFLETGEHPDLQRAAAQPSGVLFPLPDKDPQRPYVFMDIAIDSKPAGRLVIELFEDLVPAGARHLLNRCLQGSSASLQGATVHKVLPYYGVFAGRSSSALFAGSQVPIYHRLQHNVAGAVSVSRDGAEFAVSLGKSLTMDDSHQVVGRVNIGMDVLQLLDDVPRAPDDSPLMRIKIVKCGKTNFEGAHETLDEALAKETPEAAAARLKQESADTRSAVMEALQEGMSHKRSADAAGLGSGSSAAAAAAAAGAGTAGSSKAGAIHGDSRPAAAVQDRKEPIAPTNKRSKVLDSLLDDLDDEDEDEGEDEG